MQLYLPESSGFSKELVSDPMWVPEIEAVSHGIAAILWYLVNIYMYLEVPFEANKNEYLRVETYASERKHSIHQEWGTKLRGAGQHIIKKEVFLQAVKELMFVEKI